MPQPHHRADPAMRKRVAELHREGLTRNAIARRLGIAQATVTGIAADLGLTFDRSRTATATAAARVDHAARRAQLISRFYDQADAAFDRLDLPEHELAQPSAGTLVQWTARHLPAQDVKALMQTASGAVDRAVRLEQVDARDGADEAASMLSKLAASVRQAWEDSADARPHADEPPTDRVDRDM